LPLFGFGHAEYALSSVNNAHDLSVLKKLYILSNNNLLFYFLLDLGNMGFYYLIQIKMDGW